MRIEIYFDGNWIILKSIPGISRAQALWLISQWRQEYSFSVTQKDPFRVIDLTDYAPA